jgi:5-methylcytosine-specific restriction endonuclease McrA
MRRNGKRSTGQLELFAERSKRRAQPAINNRAGKRAEVLARVQAGPLSTFDCERQYHRGQATINDLVKRGHRIELETINGVSHYVYRGHESRVKVTPEMQDAYYESEHWKAVSQRRKELDGFRCCQCGTSRDLETHHKVYRLFAEDVQRELITYCAKCHTEEHDHICGSQVHFPRFFDEATARRIMEG